MRHLNSTTFTNILIFSCSFSHVNVGCSCTGAVWSTSADLTVHLEWTQMDYPANKRGSFLSWLGYLLPRAFFFHPKRAVVVTVWLSLSKVQSKSQSNQSNHLPDYTGDDSLCHESAVCCLEPQKSWCVPTSSSLSGNLQRWETAGCQAGTLQIIPPPGGMEHQCDNRTRPECFHWCWSVADIYLKNSCWRCNINIQASNKKGCLWTEEELLLPQRRRRREETENMRW